MEDHPQVEATLAALSAAESLLLGLDHDERRLATAADRLAIVDACVRLAGLAENLLVDVVGEADRADAAKIAVGCGLRSWLADRHRLNPRQAGALIKRAEELRDLPVVREAALTGAVAPAQAQAIASVLKELPDELDAAAREQAAGEMVRFAAEFDPSGLSKLSKHLLAVVAPERAEELESARLVAQEKRCQQERRVTFTRDGLGGVRLSGYLPVGDAESLITQLDARVNAVLYAQRAALDEGDPLATVRSAAQLRADALLELGWFAASQAWAPGADGDRPRVLVVMYHDRLKELAEQHGLLATGEDIAAGDLRRLLVEADLLPVVLGGESEVLDLGRERRFADPLQKVALTLRDGGCVFPGCDMPPSWCHCHHTTGWRDGGETNVKDMALYCRHHHPIVEPRRGDPPW
ncbi:MAG: DUF222 domain-containing protein, partial [Propionibacteriaceae bacterium]|nr:DUF222 domain-containing protein [Propionibacteriaceae bacterium]